MASVDPLDGLRALHLPAETTSWQADLGFAVAAGLALALVVSLALRLLVRPRRSLRASAMEEFAAAEALPGPDRRAAQAAVLRRVVRTIEGDEAARATGPAWGETLDRVFRTELFGKGAGRVFVDGLYARPPAANDDDRALDRELGALIATLRR
ncbi:DUF4381 domain-containing protein [Chenggangzhangella methanolivorans]|uniref:DUF4381 domain-containing protein n=1 Tax=Chenggangzhangella methanolivorans TaxID=1437009 RepID=A0A9E6R9C3_9HYPH|nr:DUF4381 domain-containing protein [Chenggangzhangella methanolivorans]QZN99921.1 DUF4381 domain-containing protein [Chenggangzhangella methanolivorans]